MPYAMHRIFCSTPGDLEPEREAFYEVVGEFNESEAMPRNILFVALSIVPRVTYKPVYQDAIDENVRSCAFFVQLFGGTWGPPERNFEQDYQLAAKCEASADLPMKGIAVFLKEGAAEQSINGSAPRYSYRDLDEFKQRLRETLSAWLPLIAT
jgi:hypothetical protein